MKKILFIVLNLAIITLLSCKKEISTIGKDGLDSTRFLDSEAIDTFQLETFTIEEDTLISSNLSVAMLGSYKDPEFGSVESEFYTQFRLQGFNPEFGDLSTTIIDSFVLGLEYRGHYGSLENQTFEVFELNEDLYKDSIYYSFHTKSTKPENLILANHGNLKPDPVSEIYIGSEKVESQLRLYLDTNFARKLMQDAITNPSIYESNENFLAHFKGLNVKVNNPSQNEKEGAILYFNLEDPLSKLTIYYRQNDVSKKFDFLINSECADFNHVTVNNSGKNVSNVITNPILGNEVFYAQANKSRAVVKFTSIDNIPKNSVIHYAKLELPVSYYSLSPYFPSSLISVSTKIKSTDNNLYNTGITGEYSNTSKSYSIDVKKHVQRIVNGEIENLGVYLSPAKMLSSTERIIFNGTLTQNKKKPKLYIIYTNY